EYLMMGMRISEGLDVDRWEALSGRPLPDETVDHLVGINMIERDNIRLRATPAGRAVLNAVIRELMG
ncbi:coproporphyrinogen III oxidase, partial [Ruegeria sp. NA]|nr:coproporphyrinogen III oxidase [Ruegeria sp. NA]